MTTFFRNFAVVGVLVWASSAQAGEPFLLQLEGSYAQPVAKPQSDWFSWGGSASLGLYKSIFPQLALGVRARALGLNDGDPQDTPGLKDPVAPNLLSGTAALRIRPFGSGDDVKRANGLWIEGAGGYARTGNLWRQTFEVGMGWSFALRKLSIGPMVRYLQVLQPNKEVEPHDAKLVLIGLELTALDARPVKAKIAPPKPKAPRDRDKDGILDVQDKCPTEPEDYDGFEDKDGCPDRDNDKDTILDREDKCPNEPEDMDGFQDGDGCPEPDNDSDGILDVDDKCPDKPEVINGVDDKDGCPDEGLIEFKDGRVILQDFVLFDYQKARVRSRAKPTLAAIAELWRQHPEWRAMSIEGHADERGDDSFNYKLSEKRARAVLKEMIKLGFPEGQMLWVGHGKSRPLDTGDSEEAQARNRRVEFVALEMNEGKKTTINPKDLLIKEQEKKKAEELNEFIRKPEEKKQPDMSFDVEEVEKQPRHRHGRHK